MILFFLTVLLWLARGLCVVEGGAWQEQKEWEDQFASVLLARCFLPQP